MSWFEVVKGGKVAYSGTCPKCGKFVGNGEECPMKLPSKSPSIPMVSACPMKVEQPNREELLRGLGAVTTGSAPSLFNITYGGRKRGKKGQTEEDAN